MDGRSSLAMPPMIHPLKVSENRRHLVGGHDIPFFWLADTAWELFHRLDLEEANFYLQTRAAQGFTVIMAVVLAELDGLNTPNANGHRPFIDNDPTRPVEAYFEHVDLVVEKAAALGLTIGMLPTWGNKWNLMWGVGPEVFSPANAQAFGEYLGRRYKKQPIVWILGGDRNPRNEYDRAIIRSMAKGLRIGDGGRHLMTYHPQGGFCSADFFHEEEWLDFNMIQSGHGPAIDPNYEAVLKYAAFSPTKPVLDGEPLYEDHPINWQPANGWFDDCASRRAGWGAMLSGALGHTFGNHNVWQMWQPGREPITHARTPWPQAIRSPGAAQSGVMRRILESLEWPRLVPAPELLKHPPNTKAQSVLVARTPDTSQVVVYSSHGSEFTLVGNWPDDATMEAKWMSPRDGSALPINQTNGRPRLWRPPGGESDGNDWVLVLKRQSGSQQVSGADRAIEGSD